MTRNSSKRGEIPLENQCQFRIDLLDQELSAQDGIPHSNRAKAQISKIQVILHTEDQKLPRIPKGRGISGLRDISIRKTS